MMNKSETISPQRHEDTKVDLRRAGLSAAGNQRSTTPGAPGINDQRPTGLGTAGGSGQRIPARWNKVLVAGRQGRAAFTLIEMLVVLSIIVLLIAILVPAAILAERYAYSSATQGDLAAIGQALSMYHTDFNMYPDSDLCYSGNLYVNGAATPSYIPQYAAYDYLAECLTGYLPGIDDGAPTASVGNTYGYKSGNISQCAGFTMQPFKKIYGPYMPVNSQNITPDAAKAGNYYFSGDFPPTTGAPLPILYFSATTTPSGTTVFGTNPGVGVFCITDNSTTTTQGVGVPKVGTALTPSDAPTDVSKNDAAYQQYLFLQVVGDKTGTNNMSGGTITGRDSFLLVAPGPSQLYFTGDNLAYGGQ